MAFHLPIVAAAALGVGLVRGVVAAANGNSPGRAIQKGLGAGLKTASVVGTLGLISPNAGIDFKDNGQIAYDPNRSCDSTRNG